MKELAYLVAIAGLFIPGFAMTRLLVRRGGVLLHVGIAPVATFGYLYVFGLVANFAQLPVMGVTIGALALIVALWLGFAVRPIVRELHRQSGVRAIVYRHFVRLRTYSSTHVVSVAVLVCAILLGLSLWHIFQAPFVVPPSWDAMHHGYFVRQILTFDTLDTSVVLSPGPLDSDGVTSFYPLAYNLFIAVLHAISGLPISVLMIVSTTVVASFALPLGSYLLARRLSPAQPFVAGFAALASSLSIQLYWILESGRTNAVLGLALVPIVVLVLIRPGFHPRWRDLPIAALAIVGITGLHTTELPMAVLVVVVIMVTRALQYRDPRGFLRWSVWAVAAAAVALLPLLVLEPGLLGAASQRSEIFVDVTTPDTTFEGALGAALAPGFDLGSLFPQAGAFLVYLPFLWGLLVAVGCILTVRNRWSRFLGVSIAYGCFVLLYVGLLSANLGPLSILTVPWYQDPGRLAWTLTVLGAIPAGLTLAAVAGFVGETIGGVRGSGYGPRRAPKDSRPSRRRMLVSSLVTAAFGIAIVVAVAIPPVRAVGASINASKGPVGSDSVAAFEYLRENVEPGDRVFDDMRVDGSLWMYIDHGVLPLFGNSPYVGAEPESWLERLWLRENLEKIGVNGCVESLLNKYSVRYVYFGERFMVDAYHRISLEFLKSDPHFSEVFTKGGVHVFEVVPSGQAAACDGDVTPDSLHAF